MKLEDKKYYRDNSQSNNKISFDAKLTFDNEIKTLLMLHSWSRVFSRNDNLISNAKRLKKNRISIHLEQLVHIVQDNMFPRKEEDILEWVNACSILTLIIRAKTKILNFDYELKSTQTITHTSSTIVIIFRWRYNNAFLSTYWLKYLQYLQEHLMLK